MDAEHHGTQPAEVEGGDGPLALGLAAGEERLQRLFEGLAGRAVGLGSVEHPKAGVDPDRDRVRGEQPVAEAVDRRHPGAAQPRQQLAGALRALGGPPLELGADPLAQLRGGLVGEGEGEDRVGRDALVADQPAVALDHHPGLAGAGPGLDHRLGGARLDRRQLLGGRRPLAHRATSPLFF